MYGVIRKSCLALLLRLKEKGRSVPLSDVRMQFIGADGSPTHFYFFHIARDAKQRSRWYNRIKRQHGKDGFFVTNSTVVCSKHLRKEDVRNSLTGSRFLVPGLLFSICLCLTPVRFTWLSFHKDKLTEFHSEFTV